MPTNPSKNLQKLGECLYRNNRGHLFRLVFDSRQANKAFPPNNGQNLGPATPCRASACRCAGLPNFGHHALRHFFCSNAIEAGIDFKAIAGS
jgi:integrase